ncbi:MAG: M48 family metallopeptidase [Proteobacteria bacterium]|nr:M48 family metallopeptidase [Pseudomonadota bacterium]
MVESRMIELGGRAVALVVRRSARARRLSVRIPGHDESVELVLPVRAAEADGLAFLHSRAGWVLERLARMPGRVPFADGAMLPLGGEPHLLRHVGGRGVPVRIEGNEILVTGQPDHMARRVGNWLRGEAKRRIEPGTHRMAAEIGREVTRITVRDQKSRWGSCARGGRLSFNWRLVLAPAWVLDYVVAHEVAHIAEPNHSPAFWAVVARLNPDAKTGRAWLRAEGMELHRYGAR